MRYNKIYVCSPTDRCTGGTELLQQLVYKLKKVGMDAYMYYLSPYENSEVAKIFGPRYANPSTTKIDDSQDNILIAAESSISSLLPFKNITKAIWWLSVDNYGGALKKNPHFLLKCYFKTLDKIYSMFNNEWLHFVQSEYAYQYCLNERHISSNRIYNLSDYLSKAFIEGNREGGISYDRDDVVLYNPLKGKEFTQNLIEHFKDIKWKPIINMTSQEICSLMRNSKVYIDFGNHPGKDRIPREAAICGCCIITGKRGAAANDIDIDIPSRYKFEESEISQIGEAIRRCLSNYRECVNDFEKYREKICHEEEVFEKEICEIFQKEKMLIAHNGIYTKYVKRTIAIILTSIINGVLKLKSK